MNFWLKYFSLLVCSSAATHTMAQERVPARPSQEWITRAMDAGNIQASSIAALNAREYLRSMCSSGIPQGWKQDEISARSIRTFSRLQAGKEDSALVLRLQTTDPVLRDRLSLGIARNYFLRGALEKAIPFYRQAGIANLTNTEIADAKFELAYCLFNSHQFDEAAPLFAIIREVQGKYYSAGNYYYGLLAYNRGEYADALRSFDRINNEPSYRSTVPYYMAELEYYLGHREKALTDALRLIKRSDKLYYDNELHLLAAQCLFEGDRYGEALPYFEYYYEHSDKIRKEEQYEMAYAYYRVSEWQHAIDKFKPLSTSQDSLGQTAMYLLGDSYLKAGDKSSARNAFGICIGIMFGSGLREAALLLHGQLSQELGYTNDALRSATTLLHDYPSTVYKDEANALLSRVYASTADYASAYRFLQALDKKPADYIPLLQRVSYGYGIQQLQSGNIEPADSLLNVSMSQASLPAYSSAASFWKAEIAGRQHRSADAILYGSRYLASSKEGSTVSPEATPANAAMIMGYAAMDAQDYTAAQQYFKLSAAEGGPKDAELRQADALFMQKNYAAAAPLYARAAMDKEGDYARLQQSIILGMRGRRDEKVRMLQSLLNSVPASAYAADARYELGATQMEAGSYRAAIETFAPLVNDGRNPAFAARALLKSGTSYLQIGEQDKAEANFVAIIKKYPSASERTDALAALKGLYISRNNPEGYAIILKESGIENNGDQELETTYYTAAEGQYAAQSWKSAGAGFQKYLAQFPNGPQAVKAHYYLGESLLQQKDQPGALQQYNAVWQSGWNDFAEAAALKSGNIYYAGQDWNNAATAYAALRAHSTDSSILQQAYKGMMRSAAQRSTGSTDSFQVAQNAADIAAAGSYADTLLGFSNIPPALKEEAHLYQARALAATGNYAGADALYSPLQFSKTAVIAAESRYYHASALLSGGKLKEAEDAASRNIKKSGGGDYWVVKSYLLLGDILTAEKDYFNARATLQSVVDNAGNTALKAEARRKLEALPATTSKLSNE